jgi:vesicular inhibitory amino acid transporter
LLHAQVTGAGSSGFCHTLFNGINVMCGVGLLATPYTAAKMGWLSLLLLCILGEGLAASVLD